MRRIIYPTIALATLTFGAAACVQTDEAPDALPGEPETYITSFCGDDEVANIEVEPGHQIGFCVTADGVETVAEVAYFGMPSRVDTVREEVDVRLGDQSCALDIYLALTSEETPVPQSLVDSCATNRDADEFETLLGERELTVERIVRYADEEDITPLASPMGTVDSSWNAYYDSYCGTNGRVEFQSDKCFKTCSGDCSSIYCASRLRPIRTRFHGSKNKLHMRVASCVGWTQVDSEHRVDNFWGTASWQAGPNFDVADGQYGYLIMTKSGGTYDADFQLVVKSGEGGGQHRYTDRTYDW